jgi:glycosyltransferase involved in cell wall biosynthesis
MITFIIPSIDRPSLARALQSLVAQSDPRWVAIVVFDGFYRKPPVDDPRILYTWTMQKLGTGNAAAEVRAKGIKLARTEWIAFLDDDDSLDMDYVRTLREVQEASDVVVFRMQEFGGTGRIIPPPSLRRVSQLVCGAVGISFAVRREVLLKHQWGSNWCEDYDLISMLREAGAKIKLRPEVLYHVRW